jgi:hypothetical protein
LKGFTFVVQAAAVSAIAGTFVSLPFTIAVDGGLTVGALLSQAGILLSCVLFGVTYRYAVRRDVGNLQLKSGVAAAFGLVRGKRIVSLHHGWFLEKVAQDDCQSEFYLMPLHRCWICYTSSCWVPRDGH